MKVKNIITVESVGSGHPDKICDQIADAILDACLQQDPHSRVACEVMASNKLIVIGGEITTKAYVDVVKIAWEVLSDLGYPDGFFTIISNINKQSPDISAMVTKAKQRVAAGDQGISVGYATNETKQYLSLSQVLANELLQEAEKLIRNGTLIGYHYDMKSQVSMDYTNSKTPRIDTLIISISHDEYKSLNEIRREIIERVIFPVIKKYNLNWDCKVLVNGAGKFTVYGPVGDTGLTGRKLIIDNYGPTVHIGGGSFSGKCSSKIDRTGAYFARYIAKNIVAAGLADKCEVQLAWAIGYEEPVSILIDFFGTNKVAVDAIYRAVEKTFKFNLNDIISEFKLRTPIYKLTTMYSHFGKDCLAWERIDKAQELKKNI